MTRRSSRPVASAQRIVRNTFFSIFSELSLLFTSVYFILAARHLGDADYGKFSAAIGFVGLFTLIIVFGLTYSITKLVVRYARHGGRIVASALTLQSVLALIGMVLCAGAVWIFKYKYPPEVRWLMLIVFVAETLKCFNLTLRAACKALGAFHYDTLAVNLERSLLLGGGALLLLTGQSLYVFAAMLVVARTVGFSVLLWAMHRLGQSVIRKPKIRDIKLLVRRTKVYVLQSALGKIYDNLDVVMISLFRAFDEVAWYSVSRKILEGLWFIPNMLTEAVYPELSARALVDRHLVQKLFDRSVKYMLAISIAVSLGTVAIAPWLIKLLYTSAYAKAAPVLVILGAAIAPSFLRYLFGTTLIATNHQDRETRISMGRTGTNLLLNAMLIPSYGYIGATWATLATEFISIGFYAVSLAKAGLIHNGLIAPLLKPLGAMALTLPLWLYFKAWHPLIFLVAVIGVYVLGCLAFRLLDTEEWQLIRNQVSGRSKGRKIAP